MIILRIVPFIGRYYTYKNTFSISFDLKRSIIKWKDKEIAKLISREAGMNIAFFARPAEQTELPSEYYDAITACQCFLYFDKAIVFPEIKRMLKKNGKFATTWMAWLPNEDEIA